MSIATLFRHPHLTRGVIHTASGNFVIDRGLVWVPDAVGDAAGWRRVTPELDRSGSQTGPQREDRDTVHVGR